MTAKEEAKRLMAALTGQDFVEEPAKLILLNQSKEPIPLGFYKAPGSDLLYFQTYKKGHSTEGTAAFWGCFDLDRGGLHYFDTPPVEGLVPLSFPDAICELRKMFYIILDHYRFERSVERHTNLDIRQIKETSLEELRDVLLKTKKHESSFFKRLGSWVKQ